MGIAQPMAALALMLVLSSAPLAAQAPLPCLTPKEAQAIIAFGLPDIVRGVTNKCAPVLGPTAFLAQSGKALADRYQPTANAAWPMARPAIAKLAQDNAALFDLMSDEALRPFSSALMTTAIVKTIEPRQCSDIDRVIRVVAPLSPENMSMLVGILLEIMSRPKAQAAVAKAKSPLNICPAPSGTGQNVTAK